MPKVSPATLAEVRAAFNRYSAEVEAANLAPDSKHIYIERTEKFIRWLEDDFTPGSRGKH